MTKSNRSSRSVKEKKEGVGERPRRFSGLQVWYTMVGDGQLARKSSSELNERILCGDELFIDFTSMENLTSTVNMRRISAGEFGRKYLERACDSLEEFSMIVRKIFAA